MAGSATIGQAALLYRNAIGLKGMHDLTSYTVETVSGVAGSWSDWLHTEHISQLFRLDISGMTLTVSRPDPPISD